MWRHNKLIIIPLNTGHQCPVIHPFWQRLQISSKSTMVTYALINNFLLYNYAYENVLHFKSYSTLKLLYNNDTDIQYTKLYIQNTNIIRAMNFTFPLEHLKHNLIQCQHSALSAHSSPHMEIIKSKRKVSRICWEDFPSRLNFLCLYILYCSA